MSDPKEPIGDVLERLWERWSNESEEESSQPIDYVNDDDAREALASETWWQMFNAIADSEEGQGDDEN